MVESFIIQIYRRNDTGKEVNGIVERIGDGSKQPFTTIEELWRCLSAKPPSRRRTWQRKPGETAN